MTVPLWAWAGTLAIFAVLIAADLAFTRGTGGTGLRGAAVLSGLRTAAGLAFGGALWLWQGSDIAGQYFGGYLLEKALSVDNILVFVLLFASLAVPVPLQRQVLYLGVVGALVLRGGLIAAGGVLIDHVGWIFYVFGALVLLAGVRMFRPGEDRRPRQEPHRTRPAPAAAGHRPIRRRLLLRPAGRANDGHAPARRPHRHRDHRSGIRAGLDSRGLRHHPEPVRRVHL